MIRRLKFLLILSVIMFSSQVLAQDGLQEVNLENVNFNTVPSTLLNGISIHLEDATMQLALNKIAEKGAVKLNYNSDALPLESKVSIHAENVNTIEALLMVLKQTSSKLQITKGGSLIILPAEKNEAKGKIKGMVIDANSGEALIGANVMIQGTSVGTAVDLEGKFVIPNVKPGSYTLKITYVGYKPRLEKVTVLSNRSTEITVKLEWIAVEGDVVLVTAQAKGQLSAINDQLSANEIKTVVSKDRIRELPDANAAESVGRLPGVSIMRSNGEGNKVVIRGLQPKYSKIMVDGVALASTSHGDRSVSMASISSYSLEGIEVIKSPTADMDGDQIGGSVNFVMRTAPKGLNYDIVAQGGYNGLRKSLSDYMLVGSISNRFFNNKLGVFAQFTTDQKDMSSNLMGAGYSQREETPDFMDVLDLRSVSLTNTFMDRQRIGGTVTFDYLIPDGKIYFKNFFSRSNSDTRMYTERFYSAGTHSFTTTDRSNEQTIFSNIVGYEQYLSIFKVNAKISHSYSGSETPDDLVFGFSGKDVKYFEPSVEPVDVPSYAENIFDEDINWKSFERRDYSTLGRQIMVSLDFETDFSLSNQINGKIKFGGKFKYDEHSYDYNRKNANPRVASGTDYKNAIDAAIPGININSSYYSSFFDNNFEHGTFLNGEYTLGPVADVNLMHHIADIMEGVYNKNLAENPNYNGTDYYRIDRRATVIDDYSGLERLRAGYVMTDINLTKKIKIIPGVRYEEKETVYDGVWGKSGSHPEVQYDPHDTTSIRDNSFWLPRVLLRYEPLSWMQLRLAYTQSIARPNYTYILPTLDYGDSKIYMKNTHLRPEQAESYDFYLSFSENHLGLLTIGGFYKEITDKIFTRGDRVLLNPENYNIAQEHVGKTYYTQENNTELSTVRGIEIDWQTNFWYLPSFFKGLVFNINYTKIYSKAYYPDYRIERKRNPNAPPRYINVTIDESYWSRLLDQPDDILNMALGYDYKGFSSRLSMRYTANIFVATSGQEEQQRFTEGLTVWDLSLKQELPWYGLQVYLNFNNITSSIDENYMNSGHKLRNKSYYGNNISFGLRWKTL